MQLAAEVRAQEMLLKTRESRSEQRHLKSVAERPRRFIPDLSPNSNL